MQRNTAISGVIVMAMWAAGSLASHAQSETFTASAALTTAPVKSNVAVTLVIERKMSHDEAEKFMAAFRTGGAAALRKALVGVKPTGSVQIGEGKPTPIRLTLERGTEKGRLLTMVTDTPLVFIGGAKPSAPPREGFDFAVIDIEVNAAGTGVGSIAPAAKITAKDQAFVVDDYSGALVKLVDVKRK